jgi:hypothetical protein
MQKVRWKSVVATKPKPGSIVDIPDPAVYSPGQYLLRYRVRSNGRIFAQLRFKAGKWEAVTVASVPMTEDEVRIAEQAYVATLPTGLPIKDRYDTFFTVNDGLEHIRHKAKMMLPGLLAGSKESPDSLGTLADRWLAVKGEEWSKRTLPERRRHLTRDWAPFRDRPLPSLTWQELQARLEVIKRDHGPIAANRSRSTLHALCKWAKVSPNPVALVDRAIAREPQRDRKLSLAELRAIWAAAGDGDHSVIVKLLMLTGQRREEVGGMLWSELDLDRALWSLPGSRTKNKRPHLDP